MSAQGARLRILVLGAAGFIGRHITGRLLADGHEVVGVVRDAASLSRRFPAARAAQLDLARATDAAAWAALLDGVDAVVNVAGVIAGPTMRAIHVDMPRALVAACVARGVRRFVQISAISAVPEAATEYALTKVEGDDVIRASGLDWVVLKPSLAVAEASYGGTAVLRGLAAFPFRIPMPGSGRQLFSPIHVDDLAETVMRALDGRIAPRTTLAPAGPQTLTMAEIAGRWRRWLGLRDAPILPIPLALIHALAWIGDRLGVRALGSNSVRQLEFGNAGAGDAFARAAGFRPRGFDEWLTARPAHAQERWHARLVFLRPALRWGLGLESITVGLAYLIGGAFLPLIGEAANLAAATLLVVIGTLVLLRWRPVITAVALIVMTALAPALEFIASGTLGIMAILLLGSPLLARIVVILVWLALEDDR